MMSSVQPATTHAAGPFSAASERDAGRRSRSLSAARRTESMLPAGSAFMSCPRRATSRAASVSVITPAITAATNSPMECPIIALGTMPRECHSVASAYSMQNVAGCVTAVAISVSPDVENISAFRSNVVTPLSAENTSSHAARKIGSAAYRSDPMPGYCVPCPGNAKMI